MASVFRTTRRIEFSDTDMAGIVHFANFFRFMEAAEHEFLRSRGLSVAMNFHGQSIGFPRVSAACDYQRPVRFEDVLDIEVTLTNVGRKSASYGFTFFLRGQAVATGRLTAVCCRIDPAAHQVESIEIPEEIRQRLLAEEHSG